jgi:hypothetical protein
MTTFNQGDRARVLRTCCSGAQIGDIGTVVQQYDGLRWKADKHEGRTDTTHPIVEDSHSGYFEKVEDAPPAPQEAPQEPIVLHSTPSEEGFEPAPAPSPEQALIEQQREEMRRLQERLSAALLQATLARQDHESDIEKISEFFGEKATEKRLCGEYDAAIDEINLELKVELTPRSRDYEVEFYFRQTITVTARDEEDAIEQARDAYNYGNVDSSEESEEPDVTISTSY